jgi:uncharacterized delta-60 repeat protein
MSISNINAVPYNTIQYISGVPILSISYINGVQTIVTPPLQYVLIGGQFQLYNAPTTNYIAKIDQNGDLIQDTTFNPGAGFNNVVHEIKQQPDGKYIIGGAFTTYSGSTQNRITRINQNGTRDTTFNSGAGFNQTVFTILPFSDNSSLIGGQFVTYSGSTANRIVKLTPSGAIDSTFSSSFGTDNIVYTSVTQSDGKIILGGVFSRYGSSINYIARTTLSGSLDSGPGTTFNPGVGFNFTVNSYATQSDGKIIAVGNFSGYSGSNINRIVRLNTDGTRDTTFNVGTGFNVVANRVKVQSDGKIVVVGAFTTYSGSSQSGIIRLNTDGTRDTTFNVGNGINNNPAYALSLQSDGKYIIAGNYLTYSGSASVRITRINTDGTLDTTFNPGAGFNSLIYSTAIQTDGKIIVVGSYSSYSGSTAAQNIVRLNTNGTLDTTFNTGTGATPGIQGFNAFAQEIFIEPNTQKIIVMGNFTQYSGSTTNSNRLIRLNPNGDRDTSFITGNGFDSISGFPPAHISIESDGKIYVGGSGITYSGSTVNNFVRLNPSGSIDTTFPLTTTSSAAGFSTTVRTILVSGSNIYFGGDFIAYRPTNRIIRLNTNGTWDPTFAIGAGFNGEVSDLAVLPDDRIIAVGAFNRYSDSSTNTTRIIRLNANGTQDTSFVTGAGLNSQAYSIGVRPDGKLIILGAFTQYSGSSGRNYIVGINTDGTRDLSFNTGTGFGSVSIGNKVGKVLPLPDNKAYITIPLVTTYSGSTSGNIFRVNPSGTLDSTFNSVASSTFNRTGFGFGVIATANPGGYNLILSGSDLIAVGQFQTYKSPVIQRGVMVDSTGAISSSFNMGASGFAGTVRTWATQSDGKILAGGDFTQYSGSTSNRIVRINLNGTQDTSFNVGAGFNGTITDIRIQSDGKIIATGAFSTYSGSSQTGIIRLNANGTRDTTFNVGTGASDSRHCKIQSDGKVIIVGGFTTYSGSTQNRITRINPDGTSDTTFNIGIGLNQTPEAVIIQSDGKILTTGQFTSYSGSTQNRITRINPDGTRDTTFNIGTGLTGAGFALAQQSDGKIVCSTLTQNNYSGSTARSILRINPNGTLDTSFGFYPPVIGFGSTSNTQNSLAIANDGKIYWGNSFTTYSGSIPNRIVRLNTDGSVDGTFNQAYPNYVNNTGKGANGTVNAILLI